MHESSALGDPQDFHVSPNFFSHKSFVYVYLSELPVASLVWRPPVPIVKALAVFLLLALARALALPEHPPLTKVTRPPGVWLVTFVIGGQGVTRQTPTLSLQRVHGPHEARGPGLAASAVIRVTRAWGAQLIARSISWVIDKPLLQQEANQHPTFMANQRLTWHLHSGVKVV